MKNNTVTTIGDVNYLWGLFLLIASMRMNGMDEPVLVGTSGFVPEAEEVLLQLDGVRLLPLKPSTRSLTCRKPEIMLQADTEFVTWVDSDGFFHGNCSARLAPEHPGEIHIRKRSPDENPMAFRGRSGDESGRTIPSPILDAWRKDLGVASDVEPAILQSCSACFLSVSRDAHPFLEAWRDQMDKVLPQGDAGVVDRSLEHYHQLDESVLNSLLCFLPGAPRVAEEFRLDKNPDELFIHFVGVPKPWIGWPPSAIRHFLRCVEVVEFAQAQGWKLPGPVPYCLKRENHALCKALQIPVLLRQKIAKRIGRI